LTEVFVVLTVDYRTDYDNKSSELPLFYAITDRTSSSQTYTSRRVRKHDTGDFLVTGFIDFNRLISDQKYLTRMSHYYQIYLYAWSPYTINKYNLDKTHNHIH